MVKEG